MDVIKRALLGDKNAQNEMTENGELLPCQCGGKAKVITRIDEEGHPFKVVLCLKCRIELQGLGDTEEKEKELDFCSMGEGVEDGQLLKTGDKVVFAGDKEKKIYTIAKEPFIWKGLYVVTLWEQLTRPVKVSSLRKVETE